MPFIGPHQTQLLADSHMKYLVLLAKSEADIQAGLTALKRSGPPYNLLDHKTLGSNDYQVYWQLIEFVGR